MTVETQKTKKLIAIIWQDGGMSWLWAALSGLFALNSTIRKFLSQEQIEWLDSFIPQTSIWWAVAMMTIWLLWSLVSLANIINKYRTPQLNIFARHFTNDGGFWTLGVENKSTDKLNEVVLNIESVLDENQKSLVYFAHSIRRYEGGTNPFPLAPGQEKKGKFVTAINGKIRIFLSNNSGDQIIDVETNSCEVLAMAFDPACPSPCKKSFVVKIDGVNLSVNEKI